VNGPGRPYNSVKGAIVKGEGERERGERKGASHSSCCSITENPALSEEGGLAHHPGAREGKKEREEKDREQHKSSLHTHLRSPSCTEVGAT